MIPTERMLSRDEIAMEVIDLAAADLPQSPDPEINKALRKAYYHGICKATSSIISIGLTAERVNVVRAHAFQKIVELGRKE